MSQALFQTLRQTAWSERARAFAASTTARRSVEIALVLVLAVQAGRIAWTFAAPDEGGAAAAPAQVRADADLTVFDRIDAFFRTGDVSSLSDVTNAEGDQLRLFGVRTGTNGSAIIGLPDGRQVSVGVGEEVQPGLVLQSVEMDGAVLSRGGAISRLVFSQTPVSAAAPPPPPSEPQTISPTTSAAPGAAPAAPAATPMDPERFMAQASLRPRMRGMRIQGFTLGARGDGSALRAAGLQPGDVILAVNGVDLNSLERVGELAGDFKNSTTAEIRFERGGQVQTTTVRPTP